MVHIEETSLDWALKHCRDHSFNFIPISFEYNEIINDWDKIKRFIISQNLERWKTNPKRKFIVPKGTYGYRVVTELDPIDHLVYSSLVYEIGQDIEQERSPKEDNVVFSYRFKPSSDGAIYDSKYNYGKFLERCNDLIDHEEYGYVAVTDITDFYLNIYEHRLENNLKLLTNKHSHVNSIINLLKQWNEKVSSGIPVGPIVSRLLAESVLVDIDNLLKMEDITYCRWNDDFRIFADSHDEAYEYLYKLSNFVFENHNLTLQSSKTDIINGADFMSKFIHSESRIPILTIEERLDDLGIVFDLYENFENIEISEEELEQIESENLSNVLVEEVLQCDEPNLKFIRYLISRLIFLNENTNLEVLVDNFDTLYPLIPEIMSYIIKSDIESERKENIKNSLIEAYNEPIIKTLDFARLWILHYFALNPSLIDSTTLLKFYNEGNDDIKREIIYIMGKKGEYSWIRSKKREWQNFPPWIRRSYLIASHCLHKDEKKKFHESISSRLEFLDKSLLK